MFLAPDYKGFWIGFHRYSGQTMAAGFFEFSDGQRVEIPEGTIENLRAAYVSGELGRRISGLLWVEMFALNERYGIHLSEMLHPIFDLENKTTASRTKRATPFLKEPLKGLWHKHFFNGRFIAANIVAGHGKDGIEKLIRAVLGPPNGTTTITKEHISELARRVVHEPLDRRSSTNTMTGEYIVYLPRDDGNYYLTVGLHNVPDQAVYDRILASCCFEYPNLSDWLREAKRA